MSKNTPSTSLADKLRAAGLVADETVEKTRQERDAAEQKARQQELEAKLASGTVKGITEATVARRPDGSFSDRVAAGRPSFFADIIDWGAAWFDALVDAGHAEAMEETGLTRPERYGEPAAAEAIARFEEQLGHDLPPSIRAFYREVGGVSWGGYHATLALDEIAGHLGNLRLLLSEFSDPPEEIRPHVGQLQVVPLHSLDGNYDFALCNELDRNGEATIHFVYHDEGELYGGAPDMRSWLGDKLEEAMCRFADL